jgi:hypothetical protein
MLEFYRIFVVVGSQVLQRSLEIPMGTNCVHLLGDLFL